MKVRRSVQSVQIDQQPSKQVGRYSSRPLSIAKKLGKLVLPIFMLMALSSVPSVNANTSDTSYILPCTVFCGVSIGVSRMINFIEDSSIAPLSIVCALSCYSYHLPENESSRQSEFG